MAPCPYTQRAYTQRTAAQRRIVTQFWQWNNKLIINGVSWYRLHYHTNKSTNDHRTRTSNTPTPWHHDGPNYTAMIIANQSATTMYTHATHSWKRLMIQRQSMEAKRQECSKCWHVQLGTIQVGILQRRDQRKIKSYQQRKQSSQTELIIRLQQLRTQIIGQGHSMSPTLLLQYFVTALPWTWRHYSNTGSLL